MKTVMKKMFCLMLVAVLMVGVMPFQAFAAGYDIAIHVYVDGEKKAETSASAKDDNTMPLTEWQAAAEAMVTDATFSGWAWAGGDAFDSSTVIGEGWVIIANFTENLCPDGCGNKVSQCICCPECSGTTSNHIDCKTQCTETTSCNNSVHKATCTVGCDKTANCKGLYAHQDGCISQHICEKCGNKGHIVDNCPNLVCPDCGNALATNVHLTGCIENCTTLRTCTNPAGKHKAGCIGYLCDVENCTVDESVAHTEHTGVPCSDANCNKYYGHSGKHSYLCPETGCDKAINHTGNHSNQPTYTAGSSTLKVYVNLYTGDVKTGTYELARYEGISSETVVYSFIADREDQLRAKLPAGYDWTGHVYDADNKNISESMTEEVGTGRTVHINAYSDADYVYIYVHTGRTFSNIRVIKMDGKKAGETITRNEVKAVVDDYYVADGLKMYTNDVWPSYVHYDEVQPVDSLTANAGITEIHVVVSGATSSSNTTTYTADSTNPKTGDMIFAPAAVLGLSVSALAVLFFLNKKRAY